MWPHLEKHPYKDRLRAWSHDAMLNEMGELHHVATSEIVARNVAEVETDPISGTFQVNISTCGRTN